MLVTAARINEALDKIRSVDFSIFYRDTTFSDPAHDITREFLKKEVLPDVILMPNAGTKAMMYIRPWGFTAAGTLLGGAGAPRPTPTIPLAISTYTPKGANLGFAPLRILQNQYSGLLSGSCAGSVGSAAGAAAG